MDRMSAMAQELTHIIGRRVKKFASVYRVIHAIYLSSHAKILIKAENEDTGEIIEGCYDEFTLLKNDALPKTKQEKTSSYKEIIKNLLDEKEILQNYINELHNKVSILSENINKISEDKKYVEDILHLQEEDNQHLRKENDNLTATINKLHEDYGLKPRKIDSNGRFSLLEVD